MVLQHNNTQCVTHYRYKRWEQVAKLAYLYGPTAQQHSVLSHIIMQYMQSTLLFYQFCPCIHLSDAGTVSKRMDILSTLFSHSSRGIILVFSRLTAISKFHAVIDDRMIHIGSSDLDQPWKAGYEALNVSGGSPILCTNCVDYAST